MLKYLSSLFFFVISLYAQIPNEFRIKERFLTWSCDFDILSNEYRLGYVHRKFLSWTPEYEFYNDYDELLATATMRWFTWGVKFDLRDSFGHALGSVNEKVFTLYPSFEILSSEEHPLAFATLNFWGTKYSIIDPKTLQEMAVLIRPFFAFADEWTVKIVNPELFDTKQIDPKFFITIMAFQTDRQCWASVKLMARIHPPDFERIRREIRHLLPQAMPSIEEINALIQKTERLLKDKTFPTKEEAYHYLINSNQLNEREKEILASMIDYIIGN